MGGRGWDFRILFDKFVRVSNGDSRFFRRMSRGVEKLKRAGV